MVGVGFGPNEYLVRSLARAGRGYAELVHPQEPITPVVLRQMQRARGPMVDDVRVQWLGAKPDWQAPAEIALFPFDPVMVYGYFSSGCPHKVRLEARVHGQNWAWELAVPPACPQESSPLPLLAARAAIRMWEEKLDVSRFGGQARNQRREKALEKKILQLALEWNLVSSVTSLVAVEEREGATPLPFPVLRRVPTKLAHGWGGTDRSASPLLVDTSGLELRSNQSYCEDFDDTLQKKPVSIRKPLLDWLQAHRDTFESELPLAMAEDPLLLEDVLDLLEALCSADYPVVHLFPVFNIEFSERRHGYLACVALSSVLARCVHLSEQIRPLSASQKMRFESVHQLISLREKSHAVHMFLDGLKARGTPLFEVFCWQVEPRPPKAS